LESIAESKEGQLRDKYTVKGKRLTLDEKIALVVAGKVKRIAVRLRKDSYDCNRIDNIWDFSAIEKSDETDEEAYDKAVVPIHIKRDSIIDKVMLGDSVEIAALIQAFIDEKV
jgi:hypothetical protein